MKASRFVLLGGLVVVAACAVLLRGRFVKFGRHWVHRAERAAGIIDRPQPTERKSTPPGLSLWQVDDSTKVLPGDMPDHPASASAPVKLFGARGETVAFQLVLASSSALSVDVMPGDLSFQNATLPSSAVEIFLEGFLRTPRTDSGVVGLPPGEYPDPLIPLREAGTQRAIASPVKLQPNRNQPLWVDVTIPASAAPGTYRGALRVLPSPGSEIRVPIELEVFPFEMPARRGLTAWVPMYATRLVRSEGLSDEPELTAYTKLQHAYHQMAHAHRFWTQVIEEQPRLQWNQREGTLKEADWKMYDAVSGPVLDGSLFADHEPPPIWKVGGFIWWGARPGDPPHFGGNYQQDSKLTPAHRRAMIEYAKAIRAHFNERGWTRSRLFEYMIDEPDVDNHPGFTSLIADYGHALHEANAQIDHLLTLSPRKELFDAVDIWAVWGGGYVPKVMQERQRAGQHTWFYQHHEPFVGGNCLNNDGVSMRSWPWIAWKYRVDAIFLWVGNFWNEDPYRKAINWDDELIGNGVFFYPGHLLTTLGYPALEGPVASFRMKSLRRGLFDYDYFELLRKAGGDPDALVNRIVHSALNEEGWEPVWRHPRFEASGDWEHDGPRWDAVRREAAREIIARSKQP
jgi:hypothetical protein